MIDSNKPWLFLLLFLALSACSREPATVAVTEPVITPSPTATVTVAASATPRPTATPTATPTPLLPTVTTIEQSLEEDGTVVISELTLADGGWVVVYADQGGEPGSVLGFTAVQPGQSRDVPVTIEPYLATDPLHVRLHEDGGEAGEFEYPGADASLDGVEAATATIPLDIRVTLPALVVADQEVGREESQIVVEQVTAPAPGWVVLHADDAGAPGEVLGQTPVREGENENVVIAFDWRRGTRPLHLLLYRDEGESGRFEPAGADRPVTIGDEPVAASFVPTLPFDVFVINQPANEGEVYVERALTNAPGRLAVYSDFVGLTDRLLGYVPLEAGANEALVVPIEESGITSMLHVMIHDDVETMGEFEYPGPDAPLLREGRMELFSFQTDAGNYLQTVDQTITGTQVTIPLVVADLDLWVAVHADAGGEPGEILGHTLVGPGVHRGLTVTIDVEAATPTLYAALYQDAEPLGEFEPAEEEGDVPLRFERSFVRAPFAVEIRD